MPIYTRTGDRGKTSLFSGKRVLKSDIRVESYGSVDELNSILGIVVVNCKAKHRKLVMELRRIQNDLFEVGSYLANPNAKVLLYLEKRIGEFEDQIDQMTGVMPELHNFILPGGGVVGAGLHQARTVCRRVERCLVVLMQKESIDPNALKYINRLSDLLFTMARFANHQENKKETLWS